MMRTLASKALLGVLILCAPACWRDAPTADEGGMRPAVDTPSGGAAILDLAASWLGWFGGLLIFLGTVIAIVSALWSVPPLIKRIAPWLPAIGLGCVVSSSVVGWLADHYWLVVLIGVLAGLSCLFLWIYMERAGMIERLILRVFRRKVDINGNGTIGE